MSKPDRMEQLSVQDSRVRRLARYYREVQSALEQLAQRLHDEGESRWANRVDGLAAGLQEVAALHLERREPSLDRR